MKVTYFSIDNKKYANIYAAADEEIENIDNVECTFIYRSGKQNINMVLDKLLKP